MINLCNTTFKTYTENNVKDVYGSLSITYTLNLSNINGRIMYSNGIEFIEDGKEMVIPTHRLYIHGIQNIQENDLIIDDNTGDKYQILVIDIFGEAANNHHMELDANVVNDYNLTIV